MDLSITVIKKNGTYRFFVQIHWFVDYSEQIDYSEQNKWNA